jgi:hypothetical protein
VFEAKVLKEKVGEATVLLGQLCNPASDVGAAKKSMLATLDAAAASPDEVFSRSVVLFLFLSSISFVRC